MRIIKLLTTFVGIVGARARRMVSRFPGSFRGMKQDASWPPLSLSLLSAMVLIAVMWGCSRGSDNKADNRNYSQWLNSSLTSLMDRGRTYVKDGELDSAYLMFTAVASRFDEKMSSPEKSDCEKALNNAGFISYIHHNDYVQACSQYLRALEIAEQENLDDAYPFIFINLGNLMCATGNWEEGMRYHRKAMEASLEVNDTANYLKSAVNLFTEAMIKGKMSEFRDVVNNFPKLQSSGVLWRYSTNMHRVAKAWIGKSAPDIKKALRNLQQDDSSGMAPPSRLVFFREYLLAKSEDMASDHKAAISVLRHMEQRGLDEPDLRSYIYEALSNEYAALNMKDSAAEYKLKYAILCDTLNSPSKQNSIYEMKREYDNRSINFRMESVIKEKKALMRTLLVTGVFSAVVIVLLIAVILLYRRSLRANREIYDKNLELLQQIDSSKTQRLNLIDSIPANKSLPSGIDEESIGGIDEEADPEILNRITQILESSQDIFNPDFSIEKLSAILDLPVKRVSKNINYGYGQNFATTLQTYRIHEACRRLSDNDRYGQLTIEAIAESVGFRSRSNFSAVFKKITGLSPTLWKKLAEKDKSTP